MKIIREVLTISGNGKVGKFGYNMMWEYAYYMDQNIGKKEKVR